METSGEFFFVRGNDVLQLAWAYPTKKNGYYFLLLIDFFYLCISLREIKTYIINFNNKHYEEIFGYCGCINALHISGIRTKQG